MSAFEIPVKRYAIYLCDPCVRGEGGECHTPGCSLWMKRAPDVPLVSTALVEEYGFDPMCQPIPTGTAPPAAPPADVGLLGHLAAALRGDHMRLMHGRLRPPSVQDCPTCALLAKYDAIAKKGPPRTAEEERRDVVAWLARFPFVVAPRGYTGGALTPMSKAVERGDHVGAAQPAPEKTDRDRGGEHE